MKEALFRDVFLGFVKVHLLYHAARSPIYGLEMIAELRRHGYELSPGTLYPLLHDLERKGYLRTAERVVSGKVRKYYRITTAGRSALKAVRPRIRELVDEVLRGKARRRGAHAT